MVDRKHDPDLLDEAVKCLETDEPEAVRPSIIHLAQPYADFPAPHFQRPKEIKAQWVEAAKATATFRRALDDLNYFARESKMSTLSLERKLAEMRELQEYLSALEDSFRQLAERTRQDRGSRPRDHKARMLVTTCQLIVELYAHWQPATTESGPFVGFVNDVAEYVTGKERRMTYLVGAVLGESKRSREYWQRNAPESLKKMGRFPA